MADQLRPKLPKLAAAMDEAEVDVLAYMDFPAAHRTKLHSTNSLERLNGEVKRRTDVVGIFPVRGIRQTRTTSICPNTAACILMARAFGS